MKRMLIPAILLAMTAPAAAQAFLTPQGEWGYALSHPDPERAREDAAQMARFHQLQADSPECKRMGIGCPEGDIAPAPPSADAGKSMAQIQRKANEGWANAKRLHPSWRNSK